MSTIVEGVVSYVTVGSQHGTDGAIQGSQLRLVIRQPYSRAPTVSAVVDAGPGTVGLHTAQAMARRLRVGTACTAHGAWLGCHGNDSRELLLHGVKFVRGGEALHHHEKEATTA